MRISRLITSVLALALAGAATAAPAAVRNSPASLAITRTGVSSFAVATAPARAAVVAPARHSLVAELRNEAIMNQFLAARSASPAAAAALAASQALTLPQVTGLNLSENEDTFGFQGLNAVDSATLNGFDVEPPDQMLCAGNGYLFEGVNLAFAVYTPQGQLAAGPVSTNAFFGIDPSLNLSDPRCLYDPGSNRWFATMTEYNNTLTSNHLVLAVSQTGDPRGAYNIYVIDVTNDGSDFLTGDCPCLGDQPTIGADANGFYISTNAFGQLSYEGVQIYALSKADLAAGRIPSSAHFDQLSSALGGIEPSFSIQPSTTTPGTAFASGTEFLAQSMIAFKAESQLAVWTINNTGAIGTNPGSMTMSLALVPSETYVTPVAARQKAGATPLAAAAAIDITAFFANEEDIAPDDQRLQQVTYRNGQLWMTISTAAVSTGTPVRDAAAWFVLNVSNSVSGPTASISGEGYVAGPGSSHLVYPAMTVDARGGADMVFTLTGPNNFPSAAYWSFGSQSISILSNGQAPEDGFAGYYFDSPRWGDYSFASVDSSGHVWLATELIPGPRDSGANWGTFVTRVH